MLAAIGAQCVGVVAFRPEVIGDDVLIALGPAVTLRDLHRSFRTAETVLTAATALGLAGRYELSDLSWRAAAAHAVEVNGMLRPHRVTCRTASMRAVRGTRDTRDRRRTVGTWTRCVP